MKLERTKARVACLDTEKCIVDLTALDYSWSKQLRYAVPTEGILKKAIEDDNVLSVVIKTETLEKGTELVMLTIADLRD